MDSGSYTKLLKEDPAFDRSGATYTIEGPGLPGMTHEWVALNNARGALIQSKLALEVALIGARQTKLGRSVALLEAVLESVNSAIQKIEG